MVRSRALGAATTYALWETIKKIHQATPTFFACRRYGLLVRAYLVEGVDGMGGSFDGHGKAVSGAHATGSSRVKVLHHVAVGQHVGRRRRHLGVVVVHGHYRLRRRRHVRHPVGGARICNITG